MLRANSNSQRAFPQMINRRRNVEEPRSDFLRGEGLVINSNCNFWKRSALELNRVMDDTVRAELPVEGGQLRLEESTLSKQRKSSSVYNTGDSLRKRLRKRVRQLLAGPGRAEGDQVPDPIGPPGSKTTTKQAEEAPGQCQD